MTTKPTTLDEIVLSDDYQAVQQYIDNGNIDTLLRNSLVISAVTLGKTKIIETLIDNNISVQQEINAGVKANFYLSPKIVMQMTNPDLFVDRTSHIAKLVASNDVTSIAHIINTMNYFKNIDKVHEVYPLVIIYMALFSQTLSKDVITLLIDYIIQKKGLDFLQERCKFSMKMLHTKPITPSAIDTLNILRSRGVTWQVEDVDLLIASMWSFSDITKGSMIPFINKLYSIVIDPEKLDERLKGSLGNYYKSNLRALVMQERIGSFSEIPENRGIPDFFKALFYFDYLTLEKIIHHCNGRPEWLFDDLIQTLLLARDLSPMTMFESDTLSEQARVNLLRVM